MAVRDSSLWQTLEGQLLLASVLVVSSSSLLLLLLFYRRRNRGCHPKLPPSPFVHLPLLGNLLHLRRVLRSSHRHALGPIFTLHVGRPLIFVTSAALAHEALITEGRVFADRPLLPSRVLFTSNFRNINAAPYGPFWRTMRRNLVQEMLSISKILSFKPGRKKALELMVSVIRSEAESNQGVVSIYPNIRLAMFELLLFMCFGFHMSENEILQMSALLDELFRSAVGQLLDFLPFLKAFNGRKRKAERALRARQVQLFTSHFQKHKELQVHGQLTPGSYLETLLSMDLSIEEIVTLCSEFMGGGTDTTVTTLEWAMAHVIENPTIQSMLYYEIRDLVGDRQVEETDLQHLRYLQAVIKETLRLHPPGHMLLPHAVSAPCKLGGYDIPSGSIFIFDVISVSRDPTIWKDASSFKPERFLAAEVDITGSKEVTMIPFGAGRRICPGLGLATMHMEMFVAHLVQTFEWNRHPPQKAVDFTENFGFTVRMKHSLKAIVKERMPSVKVG